MPTNQPKPDHKPKPFSFSHTKLATFRRCLQLYHWKYIEGYYPPPSSGQARGTAGHAALAEWHRSYDKKKALDAAWEAWELELGVANEEWELLETTLNRYMDWSVQSGDTFKVIQSEQEFDIEFEVDPYQLTHGKGLDKYTQQHQVVRLNGFIDGIVEDHGYMWLLENKFYKRMDNSPLDLDPQVSIYMLAALLVGLEAQFGMKLQGVIYNIVRVANTKVAVVEPAQRRKLYRNQEGLMHIQDEILLQIEHMIQYQKGGRPYRSQTKDCHWDCPFYSACLLYTDDGQYPKDTLISLSQTRSSQNGQEESTKSSD